MEILEYGNKTNPKIILIHGFQCPYQIFDEYIKYYENNYHIIVPILNGHNPNLKEDFNSFEECSKQIEEYCLNNFGQNILAIYGMSLGGVLAAHLWQRKKLNINKIILESSPLVSYNKILTTILTNQYLMLTHKTQQRDKKTLEQAKKQIIPEDKMPTFLELMDNMSDITIINYIKEISKYKLPNNIDTTNTEIYYFHGTKINELLSKKTARYISKKYPNSTIVCFKGKGHCEDSLMNPKKMIKELNKILIKQL